MRKNRLFILGIFTVMVALVSLSLVSGTWAKYTSSVSGSDSARVAKWEFTLNSVAVTNSAVATPQDVTFDLFKTIKDTDGSAETDLSATDGSIIAPGTQGSFDLVINNTSEVNATYSIDYTITNEDSIPVQFSVDGTNWSSSLEDVAATPIAHTNGTKTITVQWKWAFDGNDNVDTLLGLDGDAEISVAVKITFTQVD